uniref:Uncharacterized protein n=1 Tax=Anopheles culicifacies TaxID=139723 RepID=A0A182MV68_9DIPT
MANGHTDTVLCVHIGTTFDEMAYQREVAPVHCQMEWCNACVRYAQINVSAGIEQCIYQLETIATDGQVEKCFTVYGHVDQFGATVNAEHDWFRLVELSNRMQPQDISVNDEGRRTERLQPV